MRSERLLPLAVVLCGLVTCRLLARGHVGAAAQLGLNGLLRRVLARGTRPAPRAARAAHTGFVATQICRPSSWTVRRSRLRHPPRPRASRARPSRRRRRGGRRDRRRGRAAAAGRIRNARATAAAGSGWTRAPGAPDVEQPRPRRPPPPPRASTAVAAAAASGGYTAVHGGPATAELLSRRPCRSTCRSCAPARAVARARGRPCDGDFVGLRHCRLVWASATRCDRRASSTCSSARRRGSTTCSPTRRACSRPRPRARGGPPTRPTRPRARRRRGRPSSRARCARARAVFVRDDARALAPASRAIARAQSPRARTPTRSTTSARRRCTTRARRSRRASSTSSSKPARAPTCATRAPRGAARSTARARTATRASPRACSRAPRRSTSTSPAARPAAFRALAGPRGLGVAPTFEFGPGAAPLGFARARRARSRRRRGGGADGGGARATAQRARRDRRQRRRQRRRPPAAGGAPAPSAPPWTRRRRTGVRRRAVRLRHARRPRSAAGGWTPTRAARLVSCRRNYTAMNRPVLVRGLIDAWPRRGVRPTLRAARGSMRVQVQEVPYADKFGGKRPLELASASTSTRSLTRVEGGRRAVMRLPGVLRAASFGNDSLVRHARADAAAVLDVFRHFGHMPGRRVLKLKPT